VTDYVIRDCFDFDFCSKVSKMSPEGQLIILRDPRKILTHSNFHRYMSDLAYMPAYLHSEFVGTSVLHEMPGILCQKYGAYRIKIAQKAR